LTREASISSAGRTERFAARFQITPSYFAGSLFDSFISEMANLPDTFSGPEMNARTLPYSYGLNVLQIIAAPGPTSDSISPPDPLCAIFVPYLTLDLISSMALSDAVRLFLNCLEHSRRMQPLSGTLVTAFTLN
jgi:hypothetical protein